MPTSMKIGKVLLMKHKVSLVNSKIVRKMVTCALIFQKKIKFGCAIVDRATN